MVFKRFDYSVLILCLVSLSRDVFVVIVIVAIVVVLHFTVIFSLVFASHFNWIRCLHSLRKNSVWCSVYGHIVWSTFAFLLLEIVCIVVNKKYILYCYFVCRRRRRCRSRTSTEIKKKTSSKLNVNVKSFSITSAEDKSGTTTAVALAALGQPANEKCTPKTLSGINCATWLRDYGRNAKYLSGWVSSMSFFPSRSLCHTRVPVRYAFASRTKFKPNTKLPECYLIFFTWIAKSEIKRIKENTPKEKERKKSARRNKRKIKINKI